jgi:hypothetical protein
MYILFTWYIIIIWCYIIKYYHIIVRLLTKENEKDNREREVERGRKDGKKVEYTYISGLRPRKCKYPENLERV